MPCSDAQRDANRKNAQKSTGPKTAEGKVRSRANSYKHGLTGDGIVLDHEDKDEIRRRADALITDMAPRNELALAHVVRVAFLLTRLDRAALHEAKMIGRAMRNAVDEFDDKRLAEVEKAYSWLAGDPATNARRLRNSPEGIDMIIRSLEALQADLNRPNGAIWSFEHCHHFHSLIGQRRVDVPHTRARRLTEAIAGRMEYFYPEDAAEMAKGDRQVWAIEQLNEILAGELAKARELFARFDRSADPAGPGRGAISGDVRHLEGDDPVPEVRGGDRTAAVAAPEGVRPGARDCAGSGRPARA